MYEKPRLNTDNKDAPYYVTRQTDAISVISCLNLAGVKAKMNDDGTQLDSEEIVRIEIDKDDVLAARKAMRNWTSSTPS